MNPSAEYNFKLKDFFILTDVGRRHFPTRY